MRQDKNFIVGRGACLLAHVIQQVRPHCDRVILVKSAAEQPLPPGLPLDALEVVVDSDPLAGPVAALAAGLRHLNSSTSRTVKAMAEPSGDPVEIAVLLSGNDSPCLQPSLLRHLLNRLRQSTTALAVVPRLAGDTPAVFPLCAVYSSRCEGPVLEYLSRGGRSMRGLLQCLPVEWLEEPQLRQLDPDLRSLINLNTPADLAAWERLA
jgi:molybdopterin-guanine dinucleotide biosynthesis protein A